MERLKEEKGEEADTVKASLISRPYLAGVCILYFCTNILILTEAVVSLADLYRPQDRCSYRNSVTAAAQKLLEISHPGSHRSFSRS